MIKTDPETYDINLFSFLQRLREDAVGPFGDFTINQREWDWLELFMRSPDLLIEFKATYEGRNELEEPIFNRNYAIMGEGIDIFSMLVDAMSLNPKFQQHVRGALNFLDTNVKYCNLCSTRHTQDKCPDHDSWEFKNTETKAR